MQLDSDEPLRESDEEFATRIRVETREKIALKAKPVDLVALAKSMSYPEPSYLGNLSKSKKTTS